MGENINPYKVSVGKREGDHLEKLEADKSVILKFIFKKTEREGVK